MLNLKTIVREVLHLCVESLRPGMGLAIFLLAAQSLPAFSPDSPHNPLQTGPPQMLRASLLQKGRAQQPAGTVKTGVAPHLTSLEMIQAAADRVHAPDLQLLAELLGLKPDQIGQEVFEDSTVGMETFSGLTGGKSEVVVKWQPSSLPQKMQPLQEASEAKLYLLSWDGRRWQASYLTSAVDALSLQVLPGTGSTAPMFAVVIFRGVTAAPYPVIFRFRDHHASLAWDGRSDSSLYKSYEYGSIQFEKTEGGNVPVMVVAGRADPGLLVFPASEEQTGRGFQAATVYAWRNDSYVPVRTEYTHNRDYTLYRFIAALHLHDYKTAYSLIDPAPFLKTKKPSLKLFRERIQNVWPEFTDDKIFEVPLPARPEIDPESHLFILRLGGGKINGYRPTFTAGPAYRLTGLKRFERHQ